MAPALRRSQSSACLGLIDEQQSPGRFVSILPDALADLRLVAVAAASTIRVKSDIVDRLTGTRRPMEGANGTLQAQSPRLLRFTDKYPGSVSSCGRARHRRRSLLAIGRTAQSHSHLPTPHQCNSPFCRLGWLHHRVRSNRFQ